MNVSATGLPARLLALFFIAVLADVPVICAEERPGAAGAVDDTTPRIHSVVSATQASSVMQSTSTNSDCACPCHQTFGGQVAFTLSPLIRLPEIPDSPGFPGIFPPTRSPEHPPQNLA